MLLLDSLKTICATRCPFQMSKISDLCTKQILIIRRCIWFTELRRMAAQASHAKHRSLPLQVSYRLGTSALLGGVFSPPEPVRFLSDRVEPLCVKLGSVSKPVCFCPMCQDAISWNVTLNATAASSAGEPVS